MVTSRERDYMYRMYAAEPRARINLGIRRRLAPLDGERYRAHQADEQPALSMPGSPIIYYGDEIGMGDNSISATGMACARRCNGARTVTRASRSDPERLYLPPIMDPVYGFQAVNVEAQARDRSSLLNWMKRMLEVRKTSQAFRARARCASSAPAIAGFCATCASMARTSCFAS